MMKFPVLKSLVLVFGLISPVLGDEQAEALEPPAPEAAPSNRAVVVDEAADLEEGNPVAWLGVFGVTADEALAAQLGLEGGVVLRFVVEGSPAEDAGFRIHDVIESVDGEVLNNQDELRAVMLKHQPGDALKMKVVSGGAKKEVDVTLGERPDDLPLLGDDLEEWLEGVPFKLLDFKMPGSVTLIDVEGRVTRETTADGVEVEVRNKAGELLYKGPWNDEQDKAAVDPEVRKRIELLNFNDGSGARLFRLNGGELFPEEKVAPDPPVDGLEEAPDEESSQ